MQTVVVEGHLRHEVAATVGYSGRYVGGSDERREAVEVQAEESRVARVLDLLGEKTRDPENPAFSRRGGVHHALGPGGHLQNVAPRLGVYEVVVVGR